MEVVIMSYTSKRNIVSVAAGIALIAAYAIYAAGTNAPAAEDIKAWAVAILVFIGIGVGIQIVVQIVFHIALAIGIAVKEEYKANGNKGGETAERVIRSEMVEDEWNKIIGLKASRVGSFFVDSGVIAALITLAIGAETIIALHILFGLNALASVAEGITSIIHHERGVRIG
jgi:xanthosine utilization system XapX-like protein